MASMSIMEVADLALATGMDLVTKGKLPEIAVLTLIMSRVLGMLIVVAAGIIKLPQIASVLKSKSAAGLSVTGFEAELVAYTLTFAYGLHKGLPFSGYGESFLMGCQDIVLLAVVYRYAKTSASHVALAASVYVGGLGLLLSGRLDDEIMNVLSGAAFGVILFARVPQIYANFKAGNTGQLSIFSYALNVFGGSVRIFTSITDNAGMTMVVGYIMCKCQTRRSPHTPDAASSAAAPPTGTHPTSDADRTPTVASCDNAAAQDRCGWWTGD